MEHETLGIYLSGHPLNEYEDVLSSLPNTAAMLNVSSENGEDELNEA